MRVLVADDDGLMTESLTVCLGANDRIEVIGRARSGEEAVVLVEDLRPDIVLMDLETPGIGGVEATRRIRAAYPQTLVLILTESDAHDVKAASEAGASGFLTKDSLSSDIASAVLDLAAFAAIAP